MDHRDAELQRLAWREPRYPVAEDLDGAGIGRVVAADDLSEAGLSRAVLTDERMHCPCKDLDIDIAKDRRSRKALQDALNADGYVAAAQFSLPC